MRTVFVAALLSLLAGCKKNIEVDYPSVAPLYVVEGRVVPGGESGLFEVKVSRTSDVGAVPAASETEFSYRLSCDGETLLSGEAVDAVRAKGRFAARAEYELEISAGGRTFTALSAASPAVDIAGLWLETAERMGAGKLYCCLEFDDPAGEENYYYIRYLNGRTGDSMYGVAADTYRDGRRIRVDRVVSESSGHMGVATDGLNLAEGDTLGVELRVIDRGAYEFLLSSSLSTAFAPANPKSNFAGGCLGYFSAYSVSCGAVVCRADDFRALSAREANIPSELSMAQPISDSM